MKAESSSKGANGHMEFDFGVGGKAEKTGQSFPKSESLESDPTAVVFKAKTPDETASKSEETSEKKPSMSTIPTRTSINVKQNIDRQRREQQAVGTLLSGAALTVVISVVVVVCLAGFGGYVIYKEFHKQSVAITTLSARVEQELAQIKDDNKAANQRFQIVQDEANLKINSLQARSEDQEETIRRLSAALEAQKLALKKMDADVSQVRGLAPARRK